jgi:hypothetical protein
MNEKLHYGLLLPINIVIIYCIAYGTVIMYIDQTPTANVGECVVTTAKWAMHAELA